MPYPSYPQYPQYQPYQAYQPYQQMQPAQVQPMQIPQAQAPAQNYTTPQGLNGKFVDSVESVKATDVMMDGSVMFFPATDGKTIYTKQLQSDGTSRILTFSLVDQAGEEKQPSVTEIIDSKLKTVREDIIAGFDEISERFDKIDRQLKPKATRSKEE